MSNHPNSLARFPHTRLDAWRVALQLAAETQALAEQMPRGYGPLADRLRRAAMSTCLNLAEGAGRWTRRDKAQRFTVARAECGEVALDAGRGRAGDLVLSFWRTSTPA